VSKTNEDGANPVFMEQLYYRRSNFWGQWANSVAIEQQLLFTS